MKPYYQDDLVTLYPIASTELGTERFCMRCDEWWPLDEEFWYFDRKGKVLGRCKACWSDWNRERRK